MDQPLMAEGKEKQHLENLFNAGVHFGYAKARRHPGMRKYIAGVKSNIEVLNLERVSELMEEAYEFIRQVGAKGGTILWVGTKPSAARIIRETARELGHPYVDRRWIGGTLTNFKVIRGRINYWQDLVAQEKSGEFEKKYKKQERATLKKQMDRMDITFNGIVGLVAMPDAVFVVDSAVEVSAVHEADMKKIPTVGLINTDCNPESLKYPIPGNDNAVASIRFIVEGAKAAYIKGKQNAGN